LARLDQRLLKITPKEALSSIPDSLADLNAKLSEDGDLNITFHSSETGIGRLLEQVREAGIGVADLSTEQPNLEDVFVAMTTETA
ncbi:MAG: ABC transporter ATP-binding protein, partial [Pseudomonadota bacterium]